MILSQLSSLQKMFKFLEVLGNFSECLENFFSNFYYEKYSIFSFFNLND
jgi:hypothetical protein